MRLKLRRDGFSVPPPPQDRNCARLAKRQVWQLSTGRPGLCGTGKAAARAGHSAAVAGAAQLGGVSGREAEVAVGIWGLCCRQGRGETTAACSESMGQGWSYPPLGGYGRSQSRRR